MDNRLSFNKPVKVVHLVTSLNTGGVATLLLHLLPELKSRGIHSEVVVTLERGNLAGKLESMGFSVHVCPQHWRAVFRPYRLSKWYRGSARFTFGIRFWRLLRKLSPDLVVSNVHGWFCASQLWAAKLAGVPYFLRIGSPSSTYMESLSSKLFFEKWLGPKDKVFGVSPSVYQAYPGFFSRIKKNTAAFGEGIGNGLRAPAPQSKPPRKDILKKMNAAENSFVLGSVGRLIPTKGQKDLILAAAKLLQSHPSLHVLLVGDGASRPGLETLAKECGMGDRVYFTGVQTNPQYWLNVMDIFVSTTQFEAFPNVVVEAMAAKVPVVASNVYGNRDVIEIGTNGLLYPFGDVDTLSSMLAGLIESSGRRRELAECAERNFEEKYTVSVCANNWISLMKESL